MSGFTQGQKEELDALAEKRDLTISRNSNFSRDERAELKQTAADLKLESFTPAQREELWNFAEARDLVRPRSSRFSISEQGELDATAQLLKIDAEETAANLGFNDHQTKILSTLLRRRWLPVLAYLMLAATVAFAINVEHSHNITARRDLARTIQTNLYNNCQSSYQGRVILRSLIQDEIPATLKSNAFFVKQHVITQAQGDHSLTAVKASVAKQVAELPLPNCHLKIVTK